MTGPSPRSARADGREGFWAARRRVLVHARFRGGEAIALSQYGPDSSLNDYLRSGRASRLFDRLWALWVVFSGLVLVTGSVGLLVSGTATGWGAVLAVVLAAAAGYLTLHQFAAWRCMRRHRHDARRTR